MKNNYYLSPDQNAGENEGEKPKKPKPSTETTGEIVRPGQKRQNNPKKMNS